MTISCIYDKSGRNENFDNEIQAQVCLVSELNVTKEKLQKITTETQKDKQLVELKNIILNSWPNNHKKLKDIIKPYAKYRGELTINKDLIFKGNNLVIPYKLRKLILNKIHYNHLRIKKPIYLSLKNLFSGLQ